MNENERMARIENELENIVGRLEEIKKTVGETNSWLFDINSRVVAREVLNGEFKCDIEDLQTQIRELEQEVDSVKKAAWIGFGIIATLQFLIPSLLQVWGR